MSIIRTPIYCCPTCEKPPASERRNSRHCMIKSITFAVCSNVLVTNLCIIKIHRILQFMQSPWLQFEYIELNINFRTLSKFEKNLFKLMNNVVFSKTMENVRNHVNVRLVMRWDERYDIDIGSSFIHRSIIYCCMQVKSYSG